MTAPKNTYDSTTLLSLGNVPQVSDPETYEALLNLHNAIEAVLTSSDDNYQDFVDFLTKYRRVVTLYSDYTVLDVDGTIEVDASSGDITITLPVVTSLSGYRYTIVRVDEVYTNLVTIIGNGVDAIDNHTEGVDLYNLSSYTLQGNANADGWNII